MDYLDSMPAWGDLDTAKASPAGRAPSASPRDAIYRVAEARGLNPEHLMGLAKLETRMGEASIKGGGADTHNLFNIKDFSGRGTGIRARDSAEGSNDRYRQYASYDESADDLAGLLERKYPGAVGAASPQAFAQALKDGGYATDPNYVSKLSRTIGGDRSDAAATRKPAGDYLAAMPAWDADLMADLPVRKAEVKDKPFYSDAYEVGRQVAAGAAVDLPRMVGQGLRWMGDENVGRPMVEAANARAKDWEPDLEGRGGVAETLIKGARAVAPMAPAIAARLLPGGQFVAPTVAAGLFGTSAAQDTEDKLRLQGIPDAQATEAGWRTGLIQGLLEGAAMAVGGMAFKPMAKALGLAGKTAAGVAGEMTDTAILRPLAKGLGLNLLVQPATEVAQDVGTELNERSYGAAPEDAWDIAKDSAQGAIGLTLLLGPFAGGAHIARSKQAAQLKEALYSPTADPMVQAQARDAVVEAAKQQGVTPENIDSWLEDRFQEDDVLVAQAAQAEADGIQTEAQRRFDDAPAQAQAQNEKDQYDITSQMRVDFANQQTIPEPPASMTGTSAASLLGPRGNPLQDAIGERAVQDASTAAPQAQAPQAPPLTPEQEAAQQETQQLRQRVEQEKADVAAKKQRAADVGLKGTKAANLLSELDALRDNGDITEAERADSVVELGAGRFKAVETWLKEKFAPAAPDVSKKVEKTNTSAPPVQETPKTIQVAPLTAKETPANVPVPANPGEETRPAPGPKTAPVAAERAAAAPAQVQSVTTEVTPEGKTARVVRVAPAVPVAPAPATPDFRERNRAASTKIAQLRAERKKLVAVQSGEADVGNYGELDRASPEGRRVAQIDNEINAALPPVADIRAHVVDLLTRQGKDASVVLKSRLSAITGITVGKDGLEQADSPVTMSEVARREGVTQQAISKQLANAGLSDLHIGRLVANDLAQGEVVEDVVDEYDASSDSASDAADSFEKSIDEESSRISSSAAKAMGDGIVEVGGRDMTPEERAAEREASLMIKRAAAKEAEGVTAQDLAFAEKRRKLAEEEVIRRLASFARTPAAANAVSDWDHYRSEAIPAFADLTQAQQLDWLKAVSTLEESELNDPEFIRNLQQSQERGIEPNLPAARDTGGAAQGADVGAGQAGAEQDSETGGGSRTDQAGPKPVVVVKKKRVAVLPPKLSQGGQGQGSTVAQVTAEVSDMMPVSQRLLVVDKLSDLPASVQDAVRQQSADGQSVHGFVLNGRSYLIAENIAPGTARAVFLHEVGAHLGLDKLLSPAQHKALADKVRAWASKADGSQESKLAIQALARVEQAGTEAADQNSELIAYFTEEAVNAGIDPTAMQYKGEMARWFRSLWAAFKTAMRKLGINPDKLTAQDVVDMAYGAARLEMSGTQAPMNRTQNLVVFNDKNIQRVASLVGADAEREKFSKDLDSKFDRWFGKSKVVDADGKPLVVYHGTKANIDAFKSEREITGHAFANNGIYFGGKDLGNQYGREGAVYPVYLSIQNPFDLTRQVDRTSWRYKLAATLVPKIKAMADTDDAIHNNMSGSFVSDIDKRRLLDAGYDGIYSDHMGPVWIVLKPGQVKSAVGNNGEFSRSDDRIAFSVGPMQAQANQRLAETGQAVGSTLTRWMQNVGNLASFTEDLLARAIKAGMSSAKDYGVAQAARGATVRAHERKVHNVLEKFSNLPYAAQQAANAMLYDSTREAKWGYAPPWDAKAVVDPVMAARFQALAKQSPAAAEFVKAAFQHGHDTLIAKKKAAVDHVETEYAALIADVRQDPEAMALLQKEKKRLLERFESLFSVQGKGPYAPLRRDGNFLVLAKSTAFVEAEKNADGAAITRMMSNPDHYMVSMAKTEAEGAALAKALRDSGKYDSAPESVLSRPKEAALQDLYGGSSMMGAFLKLKSRIEAERGETAHAESDTLRKMNQMVTQMYLESLSEGSARKSEMRRVGVASQNMDMVAGFAAQGVADAQFMASVAHSGEILKAIGTMRKEWKGAGGTAEQTAKGKLFNEIVARHVQSMDFKPTPLADGLTRAASIWMLATSPAYYLANLTQTWLISLPYMSKQHQYTDAAGAIFRAYGDVKNLLGTAKLFSSLDFNKVPVADRKAIQALLDMGVIDAGLDTDMGSFKLERSGALASGWNKVDASLRTISQKVEAINRLSAGLASYRLELARTQSHEAAVEYARNVITQTHGDYTRGNAPRAFNTGAGKVALQFRKFQLIQIGLIGSLVKESFAGSTAQEKAMARKALGFMFAHLGVVGGAIALPGYALIGSLAAGLLGGDGPDDADEMLRKAIGDKHIADLLLNGLPGLVGAGIGDRIGFGKVYSALPFSKAPVDRGSFKETGYDALTGPFGGLALKAVSGLQMMAQGEFYKGMEYLLPNGLGNALKGARYATEGVTNTKGELLMNADEVRVADTFMQALGVTPLAQSRRMELQNAKYDMDGYFSKRSASIRKDYIAGDRVQAMQDWREMNEVRAARGYKLAPMSDLVRSPMAAAKKARMVAGGVQFDRSNKGFVVGSSED